SVVEFQKSTQKTGFARVQVHNIGFYVIDGLIGVSHKLQKPTFHPFRLSKNIVIAVLGQIIVTRSSKQKVFIRFMSR
ncbi:hypothetical protein OFN53_35195, partial [Escherichia coli]|nr:hypothetical protein [Escherichia coli]